jgi:hypothetical protein
MLSFSALSISWLIWQSSARQDPPPQSLRTSVTQLLHQLSRTKVERKHQARTENYSIDQFWSSLRSEVAEQASRSAGAVVRLDLEPSHQLV